MNADGSTRSTGQPCPQVWIRTAERCLARIADLDPRQFCRRQPKSPAVHEVNSWLQIHIAPAVFNLGLTGS